MERKRERESVCVCVCVCVRVCVCLCVRVCVTHMVIVCSLLCIIHQGLWGHQLTDLLERLLSSAPDPKEDDFSGPIPNSGKPLPLAANGNGNNGGLDYGLPLDPLTLTSAQIPVMCPTPSSSSSASSPLSAVSPSRAAATPQKSFFTTSDDRVQFAQAQLQVGVVFGVE